MWSKLFGAKNAAKREETDAGNKSDRSLSFIGVDMHSHLIPGIDDGAQTIEESLELISAIKSLGFRHIITTPHIKSDHYPNTNETISAGLEVLKTSLRANNIDIEISAAAEYYIDNYFLSLLDNKEPLLTIAANEVLVEFSFVFEPVNLHEIFFKIQTAGYRPVIAHPERYTYYHEKPEVWEDFKNRGCKLQLNTLALSGYYGRTVKQTAEYLMNNSLYDYCGSDIHHIRHVGTLGKMLQVNAAYKQLIDYPFANSSLAGKQTQE